MSDKNTISRRSFLKLGALALGVVPPTLADARINIGIIGLGKQGTRLLAQLLALPNVRITALCDVARPALAVADSIARTAGHTPRLTPDYHGLLSGDDCQAVVIATPDFSHTPLAMMALEQGKDVYLETPLTRTIQEFDVLQQTAQAAARILYTGISTQPKIAVAAGLVRAGLLGAINRVHIVVNTPSREFSDLTEQEVAWDQFLLYLAPRAFDASLLARWQERQQCSDGAAITQVSQALRAVHQVMGVSHPTHITAHGGVYVWKDGRDNPDTFYAILDYAEGFVVSFALHPGRSTGDAFTLYGTRGTLDLLHGQVSTDDALEMPVSDAIAQHATQQLALAAVSEPLDDLAGWLAAVQRRAIPSALSEQMRQEIMIAQCVEEAYRTGRQICFGELPDYS